MPVEMSCGYRFRRGDDFDEVCSRPARVVDRDDGTYLCEQHASVVREQQPGRAFGQIDRTIDRLIVEHVFNGRVCERNSHEKCARGRVHVAVDEMPWYAESEAEAERVVERLEADGIDLRARGVEEMLPATWRMVFQDAACDPLAICVAALTAKASTSEAPAMV